MKNKEDIEKYLIKKYIRGGNVLDLGSGGGRLCPLISSRGNYTGIDIDDYGLNISRQKYPDKKFIKMDAENLEFDNDSFNAVLTMFNTLNQVNSPNKVLKEVQRVLCAGGFLIFSISNKYYWKHFNRVYFIRINNHKIRIKFYSNRDFWGFIPTGFVQVEKIGSFFSSSYHYVFQKELKDET